VGADAADLMCASTSLAGRYLERIDEALFEKALAHAIETSPLLNYCTAAGVLPTDAAKALHATARGLNKGVNLDRNSCGV